MISNPFKTWTGFKVNDTVCGGRVPKFRQLTYFPLFHFNGPYLQDPLCSAFPLQRVLPSKPDWKSYWPLAAEDTWPCPGSLISDFSFFPWEQAENLSSRHLPKEKPTYKPCWRRHVPVVEVFHSDLSFFPREQTEKYLTTKHILKKFANWETPLFSRKILLFFTLFQSEIKAV